jgi:DNA-binding MarR family transcriptional regulator
MLLAVAEFRIEDTLTYQLLTAARVLSKSLSERYQAAVDLSPTELSVLHAIGREPGISPTAIAGRTSLDKVRVSRATQTLQRRGLARKETHAADGRSRVLRLTRRGLQLRDVSIEAVESISSALTGGLTAREREQFGRLLFKLSEGLPQIPGGDSPRGSVGWAAPARGRQTYPGPRRSPG